MSTSIPVKKALSALLRDSDNSNCADCKTQSHPRWASWSLGVFICIKCAGVHRSLGTHVSKVKSVDLDTWKEEHLEMLVKMKNNINANSYYECNLDPKIKENLEKTLLDSNKLQTFIRTKYQSKKWIGNTIPQSNHISHTDKTLLDNDSLSDSTSNINTTDVTKSFDDLKLKDTAVVGNTNMTKKNNNASSRSNSILNLEKLSSAISVNSSAHNSSSNINQSTNKLNQRPDLKKSILSLYSKSNANVKTNSSMDMGMGTNMNAFNQNNNGSNLMMSGTSSASSSAASSVRFNNGIIGSNNNNTSNSVNNSTISLDDNELFKNVWS